MKAKSTKAAANRKINWAAKVRGFRPRLNALSNGERQQLLTEALAKINGRAATTDVRRG
jgi:hypothetical protein